ncbi:glycosyltransferase family 4 protein [Ligilactobacillus sp. WILCCON 0076]|uniref:Glycosyltransferase family 4 protein n=1 Tax=Ligilactobacillus ubinensis TaxID=2876789 RepID=A0A9X2FLP6_9LACO|nr:glycosyltransferase family 4 protein [Ligilactobacillus ubinensis]MCP0887921.1 glycosyltransferase family 4 protein [Ligilactobacillus ubinensis]
MLDIHMFSSATKVKGQGVGSAYTELIKLLKKYFPDDMKVSINQLGKADISHYHTVDLQFYLSTFLPGRGKKIGYVHFLPETLDGSLKLPRIARKIFYSYVIKFYKRMDSLVVVNPSFIQKLEQYNIPKDKITYIPNFVSKKEFYKITVKNKYQLRKELQLKEEPFTVVGVGQVQARKGVPDFIKLARRNPNIQFVWVGGFSFGRITDGYDELKKVVDNPPENLFFPGIMDREKMNVYYNMADLFLLPSYNELFPMSVLEAFSCETPVMLRDLELYHDIIADYYEPAVDINEMESKIKQLQNNPEKMKKLQEKARVASAYYSENRLAMIWKDYYQKQAEKKN